MNVQVVGADKLSLIDVSVSNSAALCNSALVKTLAETDTRVLLLGRLLKHWASQRGINNRSVLLLLLLLLLFLLLLLLLLLLFLLLLY